MQKPTKVSKKVLSSFLLLLLLSICLCSLHAQALKNMPVQGSFDSLNQVQNSIEKDRVYEQVEKMPQFPGGEKALSDYLSRNLKYPPSAYSVQGTILVEFIVNEFGKVRDVTILRGLDPEIDYEGLTVISSLPDWLPGEENGKKVNVRYTIPLTFRLEVDKSLRPAAIFDGKLLPIDFDIKKLNKDSIQSVFVIKPDQKEKLALIGKKYDTNTSNGVFILVSKACIRQHSTDMYNVEEKNNSGDKIYDNVTKNPEFPGGEESLIGFVIKNMKYPVDIKKKGIMGNVILRFVVSSTGKVTQVKILSGFFPALDSEVIRVVESLPDWNPGELDGVKVNAYYTLPLSFLL